MEFKQITISDNSPIFIVGMTRSGTIMLGFMLSRHPNIAISPESHFCETKDKSTALNWLKYVHIAQFFGRKTGVIGVSLGDIWREETITQVSIVLNKVDIIGVRDERSKEKLKSYCVTRTIHIMSDLTLSSLTSSPPEKKPIDQQKDPINIGFSVRHLADRGKSIDRESYISFQKS